MTQTQKIVNYCKKHGSISAMEAMSELGITQLGARIDDLQKKGIFFRKEWDAATNRDGEIVRFKRNKLWESR